MTNFLWISNNSRWKIIFKIQLSRETLTLPVEQKPYHMRPHLRSMHSRASLYFSFLLYAISSCLLTASHLMSWICSHASTSILDVRIEGPLAHAPRLYRTKTFRIMTWHSRWAPIRLSSHFAKVTPSCAARVDTNMMRTCVIVFIYAISSTSVRYPERAYELRRCDVSTIPLKGRKHETNIIVWPLTADLPFQKKSSVREAARRQHCLVLLTQDKIETNEWYYMNEG